MGVRLRVSGRPIEGAERAVHLADVRVVGIRIDHEGDFPLRMPAETVVVGKLSDKQQGSLVHQPDGIGFR